MDDQERVRHLTRELKSIAAVLDETWGKDTHSVRHEVRDMAARAHGAVQKWGVE